MNLDSDHGIADTEFTLRKGEETKVNVSGMRPFTTPSRFLGRRALHDIPPLRTRIDQGLPNFLPPPAYKRLNEEVKDEGLSVVDTIIRATPERSFVLAFNYASSTTTSSFHSSPPSPKHLPPPTPHFPHLLTQIRLQHGSLTQLKSPFSAAAMEMFTNGYIWFVTDAAGNTAVIPTFGPGSLLIEQYEGENEDYEAESEANASPTPALTPKSPPPGVSPSSASGVSSASSSTPMNHPLHPRFIHTPTPSLADKKNLGEENMIPASLFDEPTP
ncbi:hypothetical protein D9758_001414 [Tetrapyrgos nigripes]|uniref:Manganese/iron superoxide dismutase C-terminal domain-containing protein n=1 Tax=Tetrapyrgos nigripes TaxID=182062 RepID=A0A8H5GS16_9AGAR|nr:hypothetical protein D9758_001414 [Tetrapyrgos nigripes]